MEKHHFNITIIGAGVVGLAIAEELSRHYKEILLLEKNESQGQETSSRNSEVIHAGIYYPEGSLKASLCVEGRKLLYEACEKRGIPYKRIGKLIVATNPDEEESLQGLQAKAQNNGVDDLLFLSGRVVHSLEPDVMASAGLLSPSTGIIDSHSLMRALLAGATDNGVTAVFRSCRHGRALRRQSATNWRSTTANILVASRVVVNCAGLQSDCVAALPGIDVDLEGYRLKLCKGSYFAASPAPRIRHLVYPVPTPKHEGLGVHATLDLGGRVRFGPDVEYVDVVDYRVDEGKRDAFHASIITYLPGPREGVSPPRHVRHPAQAPGPGRGHPGFRHLARRAAWGFPAGSTSSGSNRRGLRPALPLRSRLHT